MTRLLPAILSLALLNGCSTMDSFQRRELATNLATGPRQISMAKSLEEIDALKPQLKLPMRLVVSQPSEGPAWTQEEIREIESWRQPLKQAGIVSQLFVLPDPIQESRCNDSGLNCIDDNVRLLAARFQADGLLSFSTQTQQEQWANPASILNLSIIGMWLVPAHHREAQVQMEGALKDVRNGYLYAYVRSFGEDSRTRPLIYADENQVEKAARLQALQNFGKRLLADIQTEQPEH